MNPDTGMLYELRGDGPPAPGARIDAQNALDSGAILEELLDAHQKEDLEGMLEKGTPLVAVEETVVQKLRLGERELERRRKRKRA